MKQSLLVILLLPLQCLAMEQAMDPINKPCPGAPKVQRRKIRQEESLQELCTKAITNQNASSFETHIAPHVQTMPDEVFAKLTKKINPYIQVPEQFSPASGKRVLTPETKTRKRKSLLKNAIQTAVRRKLNFDE